MYLRSVVGLGPYPLPDKWNYSIYIYAHDLTENKAVRLTYSVIFTR